MRTTVPPPADSRPARILLIDDDQVDRRVARRHLSKCGIALDIVETSSPIEAERLAGSGRFDCILMDYRYPEGSAFDLFADLLAEPCSRRPPIVLLTGSGGERVAAASIQRGAQEYLSKVDVGPEALRLAIESALHKGHHQRELERRDEELVRMSFYDALTDLPNRRLFFDRLEQAARASSRTNGRLAVLMMDLNLFKTVNDSYGHEVGDELLRQVARRLRGVVRESDTVARLGGDEFAAILSVAGDLEGAIVVAEKIIAAVSAPFALGEHVAEVGITVGIALCPDHGRDPDALLRHADTALYQGKRSGGGIRVYGAERDRASHQAAVIATDLPGALTDGELFTVYQPQVRLADGAIVGAEALVRWRHPELGLLPAHEFVPAAERTAAIEGLTSRVLDLALAHSSGWRREGLDLQVAVNISGRLLAWDRLVDVIEEKIAVAGVPARSLCLEVTETAITTAPHAAERTLGALSEMGVRLSIDDFGTGYSSLKYLRNLPIDEIKIDGLFIESISTDHRDAVVVESVIALGRNFGVRVVAEGIENEAAATCLLDMGCELGQGHYFGHAMSANEFRRWHERVDAA